MSDDTTRAAVVRFDEAFNLRDIDAVAECITEDCVFEDTTAPDGRRHEGRVTVLAAWRQFFADSPAARFEIEEIITMADRAVVRWRYEWSDGHVRGVDLMRVRDGRIAESVAYVKG